MLDEVESLDQDKILRRFFEVINASTRTNYYQKIDGEYKPYLSFKIRSSDISQLKPPQPRYEIFVYARGVEGVHMRGGKVARGGIRWSYRREDYRREVLDLMIVQMMKNAVIVPVGAKGGFYIKEYIEGSERIELKANEAYEIFIRGLLDLTDNLVNNEIVHPQDTKCLDEDDYYLVVAADRGTATFSDLANEIAKEYKFWLGDAFASGGSTGYDHKKLGITARGAWESIKFHFQELGVDITESEISVVGIGDMSGDVFGNGMLLSSKIKLVAAFNHSHIFIDPDPDPILGFQERKRLFRRGYTTWEDYDRIYISSGGGVFSRKSKQITLTPQIQNCLGTTNNENHTKRINTIDFICRC